jgi:hypothetical protein
MYAETLFFERLVDCEWKPIGTVYLDHEGTVVGTIPADFDPQLIRKALDNHKNCGSGLVSNSGVLYLWHAVKHHAGNEVAVAPSSDRDGFHNFSEDKWRG